MRRTLVIAALALIVPGVPLRADPSALALQVREYRRQNEAAILSELAKLVSIPNVASDSANIRRNAGRLVEILTSRGIETRLLDNGPGPPAVFGELRAPSAKRTVVLYAHYDGQPVDPSLWSAPPWKSVLRDAPLPNGRIVSIAEAGRHDGEWRLYGRSVSDDRGPIIAMMTAIDALRSAGVSPSVNLKFFFEGEEETGSGGLDGLLERNAVALSSDAWIFCDGPVHQSRRQQVVFGVRGSIGLEMTIYGPLRALHSGHYGNWAPNPAAMMADLIAGMRGPDGAIRLAGFLDDVRPVTPTERAALAKIPAIDSDLRRALALGRSEADNAPLAERIMLPAVNVRGIDSGHVGDLATNAIPTIARASIDFRLVPDQTTDGVRDLVESHIRGQGYRIVRSEPDTDTRAAHARTILLEWEDGYAALRTPMDLPVSRAVLGVVEEALGEMPIAVPMLGGSLPLMTIAERTRVPLIILPTVNHDNNQHAPDENLRLQNLWDGIEVFAVLMSQLGQDWEDDD